MVTRRTLLTAALLSQALLAKKRMDKSRISAITDEIGLTPEDAIAFAKQYGLQWVELRNVPGSKPGREYAKLSEAELKAAASTFAASGLKVSFLNTSLYKYDWPGMEGVRSKPEAEEARSKRLASEQKRWEKRREEVAQALTAANILGCDKVRVFTGTRVADPLSVRDRIVEEIGGLTDLAAQHKVYLLVENEYSQNIGTAKELASLMKQLPSQWIGMNWDPENAVRLDEPAFPDGYRVLPQKKLMNVQFKASTIMNNAPRKMDWAAIMDALGKDNYPYRVGLETHIFDGTLIQAAHESMENMLRIVG